MKNFICIISLFCFARQLSAQGNIFPLSPFNQDTIENNNPLFTWYTINSGSNDRVTYTYVLVEMGEGQTADEAINANIPIIRADDIQQSQLLYPLDATPLKEKQWYAWQIQKYWANSMIDKSETWKFILVKPEIPNKELKYAKLKKKNDGTFYEVNNGKVYFMMDEKYVAQSIKVSVLDNDKNVVIDQVAIDDMDNLNHGAVNVKSIGANFYVLDLGAMNKAGIYEMQTADEKGKKYVLPFIIK